MHRVDDDAREPRGIENALVEIEFPGAVLLRHQPALQPVGKPRDHALQMRELLVEIAAQPVEFFRLAQILGRDLLVELGDEGRVFRAAIFVVAGAARTPRLAGRLGIAHIRIVGHVRGLRIDRFGTRVLRILSRAFGLLGLHALHVGGVGRLSVLAGIVLTAVVLALFGILVLVRLLAALLAHVERVQQIVHGVAETSLVLHQPLEPVEARDRPCPPGRAATDRRSASPQAAAPARSAARAPAWRRHPQAARRRDR